MVAAATVTVVAALTALTALSALSSPQPSRFEVQALNNVTPVAAVLDAGGERLYVAARAMTEGAPSMLAAIEIRRGRTAYAIEVPATVTALQVDGDRLLVASATPGPAPGPGRLTVLDTKSARTLYRAPTGINPIVATRGSADEILILSQGTPTSLGLLSILNAGAEVLVDLPVGVYPSALVVDRQHEMAFVSNQLGNTVSVVDLRAHSVVRTVVLGPAPGTLAQLAFDAGTGSLVAMSYPPKYSYDQPADGLVQVIDASTFAPRASATLSKPVLMRISPSTGRALVVGGLEGRHVITAVDAQTASVTWTRQFVNEVDAIATGTARYAYLMHSRERAVTILNAANGQTICSRTLGGRPMLLVTDGSRERVFAVVFGGEVVQVTC